MTVPSTAFEVRKRYTQCPVLSLFRRAIRAPLRQRGSGIRKGTQPIGALMPSSRGPMLAYLFGCATDLVVTP